MRLKIISICSVLLLAACSTTSPMKVALTELGTSSKSEYGAHDLRMMRSINITGIAPEETIGSISVDPDRFNLIEQLKRFRLNPQDLPDILTPRLNDGTSIVYERTFCGNAQGTCPTNVDITDIKNAIQLQEVHIANFANLQIEQQIIELVESAIARTPTDADKLLAALKLQLPANENIKTSTKDDYGAKFLAAKNKIQDDIDTIKIALEKTKIALNKPGIIVTNWKYESDLSAESGVPGLGGAFNKNKDIAGYAIFGNPVVRSLHFGTYDITGDQNNLFSNDKVKKLFSEKRLYMTFYQVRARQVLYAESLESILGAQLTLKVKQLVTTLKPLLGAVDLQTLSQLELTASATYARFSLSANQGFLDAGSGKFKSLPFDFGKKFDTLSCENDICDDTDETTVPIINSRINLYKYFEAYKNTEK